MKKSKKFEKAKFYCESCGAEVAQNAKVCTYCGKFFSSVRCPKCGKTGNTEEFKHGCPNCGYAVNNYQKNKNIGTSQDTTFRKVFRKNHLVDSGLPIWVYIACLITLIILIIGLYSCLQ